MFQVQPVPDNLVDEKGQVNFGIFDGPFRDVNLTDARLTFRGLPLPSRLVNFRLKEWQHFAIILPEIFVGFAIVDAKFTKTSWCHFVDRRTGEHFEHKRDGLFTHLRLARELWRDHTYLHSRGYNIDINNHLECGEHRIHVKIKAARDKPAIEASICCLHDLSAIQPLVVVFPVGKNQAMYTHKVALPVTGTLRVGDITYQVDPECCFAILDIHKAHYPRHTWWNWATFAGRDRAGRLIAMNFTRNVNLDDRSINENALWVDGKLHHLGPAIFHFNRAHMMAPWHLSTDDGQVDLIFTPQGERSQKLNLGLARSVFHQPYGTFKGTVQADNETVEIDNLFGVCEDHDTLW